MPVPATAAEPHALTIQAALAFCFGDPYLSVMTIVRVWVSRR